jgi:hypothetical protein
MIGNVSDDYYLFFRRSCLKTQQRFAELADLSGMPRVFLHGNPHVDNYARNLKGEGMVDFDRSRLGPYAWDVVRFMGSISLRRSEVNEAFLPDSIVKAFSDGYLKGLENPEKSIAVPELLAEVAPKKYQKSMEAYLDSDKKWAKKLRLNPVFATHPTIQAMFKLYFKGRFEPEKADDFWVEEAGLASGSLGKPRVLMVISPKKSDDPEDRILLDIKEVYADPDTEHFINPFSHHGYRMIEASHLYAPGLEEGLSHLTWKGNQFWGRRIPFFKAKFKGNLDTSTLEDFSYRVGVQLGQAHRRSAKEVSTKKWVKHYQKNLREFLAISQALNLELDDLWVRTNQRFEEGADTVAQKARERLSDILSQKSA